MEKLVEVARSYSQKLNTGNYTSADFFCSLKEECKPDEVESVSKRLIHFCKLMVLSDIKQYLKEHPEMDTKEKVIDFQTGQLINEEQQNYEENTKNEAFIM